MNLATGRLAAFDIETTGVEEESARVVTAAVLVVEGGLPTHESVWLLNPGIAIPAGASRAHGVTTERAEAEGRSPAEAIDEITGTLADHVEQGVAIVAFNARFDLTVLDREARRHGVRSLLDRVGGPGGMLVVDPLVLDRQFDRFRRGQRTLGAMCRHYGVPRKNAHAASEDALAAALLAVKLGSTLPELRRVDLGYLHRQQICWAAEQAASLEEHFREQGRIEYVERAWPIIPGGAV
jgi:DNA polymerase-3 subunit epsilon